MNKFRRCFRSLTATRLMFRPSRPSHSSSEEDNANSLDEKYGKDKRETYPMSEAKKNPEATGKLLDQPSV